MAFKLPDYGKITISISVVGIIALIYVARKIEPNSGPGSQPRRARGTEEGISIGGIFDEIWPHEEGDHFCHPKYVGGPVVYTRHRYPHRVGHEIATVLELGFPAMLVQKPQDYDWICDPPSEATL